MTFDMTGGVPMKPKGRRFVQRVNPAGWRRLKVGACVQRRLGADRPSVRKRWSTWRAHEERVQARLPRGRSLESTWYFIVSSTPRSRKKVGDWMLGPTQWHSSHANQPNGFVRPCTMPRTCAGWTLFVKPWRIWKDYDEDGKQVYLNLELIFMDLGDLIYFPNCSHIPFLADRSRGEVATINIGCNNEKMGWKLNTHALLY